MNNTKNVTTTTLVITNLLEFFNRPLVNTPAFVNQMAGL